LKLLGGFAGRPKPILVSGGPAPSDRRSPKDGDWAGRKFGNSLAPHLHFHLSDDEEVPSGEGVPFVIDEFELVGRVPTLGALLAGGPWLPSPD
jgi:hypothetical protein